MNKQLISILTKLQPLIRLLKRYQITIFIVSFLGIYGFLVVRVNNFINSEPSDSALKSQAQTVKRLKIDQKSIDSILELEEQNIEVKTLFENARKNPFNE